MSIVGLTCVLLALVAALLGIMYLLQRRELAAIDLVSQQVQRIAIGGSMNGRVEVSNEGHEVSLLATAVNHLLTRVTTAAVPERASPLLFAELADRIHEAVLVHGDTILHANRQFATLIGVDPAQLTGRRLGDMVPPEYADLVNSNIAGRLAGEPAAERYEIEMNGLSGQLTRLEITSTVIEYEGSRALLMTGVEILPTMTVRQLPALVDDSRPGGRGALALDALSEAVLTTDGSGCIDYMNPAAVQLTGVESSQYLGRPVAEVIKLVDEADGRQLRDPVQHALTHGPASGNTKALLLSRANGPESAVELSAAPLPGVHSGTVLMLRDVTEQRGLARKISYQATHDALTGLHNRREFERRVGESIESAHRGEGHHVLCFLDLDRFKTVNDTSGHLAGDSMLRELARLLRESVRDSDVVGRLGGDEFGMLLVGCPLDKARQIADDVCRKVGEYRFVWKDRLFDVGVSVGLVEISRESGSVEDMLAAADAACYVAKKEGAGRVAVYSARDEALARHNGEIHWLQRLQSALKENRFHLYHQTIVPSSVDDTAGPRLEVLVRLSDETGRDVAPAEFMRAAERHKLMRLVDRWVVQTTLNALSRGDFMLLPQQSVSINISAQTLADEQFLEFVVECLDRTGVSPRHLCFEIGEAAVSANMEAARRFVGVLHGMGCEFALDDFGSDVGSFSRLRNLPLDYLKIDGTLMRNLARDSINQAMVTAMIKLARSMKFKVIAEQVEDIQAADFVRHLGVDYLQGYAIGVPHPFPAEA